MNRQRLQQLEERRLKRMILRLPEIPKMVEAQAEAVQVIVETQVEAKVVVKPEVQKPQVINDCF